MKQITSRVFCVINVFLGYLAASIILSEHRSYNSAGIALTLPAYYFFLGFASCDIDHPWGFPIFYAGVISISIGIADYLACQNWPSLAMTIQVGGYLFAVMFATVYSVGWLKERNGQKKRSNPL